jgi:hypothetical protein
VIRKQYYGWFDPRRRKLMLSTIPPDAPIRPAMLFESRRAVQAFVEKRKGRVNIMWSPPLPINVDQLLAAD